MEWPQVLGLSLHSSVRVEQPLKTEVPANSRMGKHEDKIYDEDVLEVTEEDLEEIERRELLAMEKELQEARMRAKAEEEDRKRKCAKLKQRKEEFRMSEKKLMEREKMAWEEARVKAEASWEKDLEALRLQEVEVKRELELELEIEELELEIEEEEQQKKQMERDLSAKKKVDPVKSKRREDLERREILRFELTRLEREEEEEKDKMALIELEKTKIPDVVVDLTYDLAYDVIIDQLNALKKKMENLEKEKFQLEEKRKNAKEQAERAEERKCKAIEERKNVKTTLDTRARESQQKIAQVREQLKTVRKDLRSLEGGERVGDLEGFMDQQILELESELKCPVCFEVARTGPIYKCSDDHLICR